MLGPSRLARCFGLRVCDILKISVDHSILRIVVTSLMLLLRALPHFKALNGDALSKVIEQNFANSWGQ